MLPLVNEFVNEFKFIPEVHKSLNIKQNMKKTL